MTTLLLVDDHQLLRQSLRRVASDAGFEVVGEAADGAEALRLAVELQPDLVLMDVAMPNLGGLEATRTLRHRVPGARVVVLTMHGEEELKEEALRAGAVGFLSKDCTMDEVTTALRAAADGATGITAELARVMLAQAPEPAGEPLLSKREEQVLQLFADGYSTTEVASRLFISAKTVKNHLASAYEKLDARDRTQAVLRAVRMGIIRLD